MYWLTKANLDTRTGARADHSRFLVTSRRILGLRLRCEKSWGWRKLWWRSRTERPKPRLPEVFWPNHQLPSLIVRQRLLTANASPVARGCLQCRVCRSMASACQGDSIRTKSPLIIAPRCSPRLFVHACHGLLTHLMLCTLRYLSPM